MNIGFVSTWFERGAAYVTKSYIKALEENNSIYVYARAGESYEINNQEWDLPYVTWGFRLQGTSINFRHFDKWITKNQIDVVFFNEQHEFDIIAHLKKKFPKVVVGTYIDYYKEDTIDNFKLYDFLICNTLRHYSVFKEHHNCFFVPWGTDTSLYTPKDKKENEFTFFHSVGMSKRKGTDILLRAFIEGGMNHDSKLIIHSQLDFKANFGFSANELKKYNIEVIEKTVSAPGLYHLGDVYVYPTTLDGLGLTIYEALSCGLPVITTNNAPMNEVVNSNVGYLVKTDRIFSRSDGYFWPLSICNKESLIENMRACIENKDFENMKCVARKYAEKELNWRDRNIAINEIFNSVQPSESVMDFSKVLRKERRRRYAILYRAILNILPDKIVDLINKMKY